MSTTPFHSWVNGACNNRYSAVKHGAVKNLCVHHLEPLTSGRLIRGVVSCAIH